MTIFPIGKMVLWQRVFNQGGKVEISSHQPVFFGGDSYFCFFEAKYLGCCPPECQDSHTGWPYIIPSLKLTFSHLKIDAWNTFSFPFGFWPIFRGELAVSFTPQTCQSLDLPNAASSREEVGILPRPKKQKRFKP